MFNNIRTALAEHYEKEFEKFAADLSGITAGAVVNSWYYKELCTPAVYKKIAAMAPDAAIDPDLLDRIKAKKARNNKKAMSLYIAKLDAAEAANDASTIYISVEWKKSRVWGANPTATITGSGSYSTGYASGCGYDKESAAIAEALNDNPVIMRILYEHADKGGAFPYGVTTWAGVPSFDGGCGVSVFYNIFNACGYTFNCVAGGKMFNAYTITKK